MPILTIAYIVDIESASTMSGVAPVAGCPCLLQVQLMPRRRRRQHGDNSQPSLAHVAECRKRVEALVSQSEELTHGVEKAEERKNYCMGAKVENAVQEEAEQEKKKDEQEKKKVASPARLMPEPKRARCEREDQTSGSSSSCS